jgi:hypothetical protein
MLRAKLQAASDREVYAQCVGLSLMQHELMVHQLSVNNVSNRA